MESVFGMSVSESKDSVSRKRIDEGRGKNPSIWVK